MKKKKEKKECRHIIVFALFSFYWRTALFTASGFFGVFTVPKLCSLYSAQLTAIGKFLNLLALLSNSVPKVWSITHQAIFSTFNCDYNLVNTLFFSTSEECKQYTSRHMDEQTTLYGLDYDIGPNDP